MTMKDPPQQQASVLSRVRIFEGGNCAPSEKQNQMSPKNVGSPVHDSLPRKPTFYKNRDASPSRNESPLDMYAKRKTFDRGPPRVDPSGRVSPRVDLKPARAPSPSVDPPAQKNLPAHAPISAPHRKRETQIPSQTFSGMGRKLDAAWARSGRSTQRGEDSEDRSSVSSCSPERKLHQHKAFMRYSSLSPSSRDRKTRGGSVVTPVNNNIESRSVSVPRQPLALTSDVMLARKDFMRYAYRTKEVKDRESSPVKAPQLQRHRWEDRDVANNVGGRRDAGTREHSVEHIRQQAKEVARVRELTHVASTPVSQNRAVSLFLNNGRRIDPKPTVAVQPKLEPKESKTESTRRFDAKIRSYKIGSFPETIASQNLSSSGSKDNRSKGMLPSKTATLSSYDSKDTCSESPSPTKTPRFCSNTYNPLAGLGARELKKNLDLAATVMKEEKMQSIGSSSSSSRSELSHEELGGIANRALALSQMRNNNATSTDRLKKSPLGQMISEKRIGKLTAQQDKPKSVESITSYGSAQRLSDRLTRAERFLALKTRQVTVPEEPPDDDASAEMSSQSPGKDPHPVFGYGQQRAVNQERSDTAVGTNTDILVLRRSRLLSKSMQWKASSPSHNKSRSDVAKKGPSGVMQYRERNFEEQTQTKVENSSHEAARNAEGREEMNNRTSRPHLSSGSKSKYEFSRFQRHLQFPTPAEGGDRKHDSAPDFTPNGRLGPATLDFLAFDKQLSQGNTELVRKGEMTHGQGSKKSTDRTDPNAHRKHFNRKLWNDRLGYGDRSSESDRRPGELSISVSVSSAESSEYYSGIGSVDDQSSDDHEHMRQQIAAEISKSNPSGHARRQAFEFQGRTRPIRVPQATQAQPHSTGVMIYDQSAGNQEYLRQNAVVGGHDAFPSRRTLHNEHELKGLTSQTSLPLATPTKSNMANGSIKERPNAYNPHIPKKNASPIVQHHPKGHVSSDVSEKSPSKYGPHQHRLDASPDGSSSDTTQDPLQWFHNKYGVGSPEKKQADPTTPILSAGTKAAIVHSSTQENDDDDDVFDGLDDETIDLSKLANSPTVRQQFRQALHNRSQPVLSPTLRRAPKNPIETKGNAVSPQKRDQNIPSVTSPSDSHQNDVQRNQREKMPSSPVEKSTRAPFQILTSQLVTKGEMLDSHPSLTILDSTTLQGAKKPIRGNPDNPKIKAESESITEVDENEDVSFVDEESIAGNDTKKDPGASFVNLGVAFVNSIKNSCAVPDRLPEVTACASAIDAKMRCVDKINGAFGNITEKDSTCKDYEQKITVQDDDPAALDKLNDVERRIRVAWDQDLRKEDDEDGGDGADYHTAVGDMLDEVDNISSKSSTSTLDPEAKERIQKYRAEAQTKLLDHVDKAMQLVASRTGETGSSDSTGPIPFSTKVEKQDEDDAVSPSSNLSAKLSFEQRTVLENFSTQLKNQGVEVLKLGRRNRWQVRYLTVSRETISLLDDGEINCCPKALLWPKQRNPPSCSISSIKDNGRGGLLFDHLKQARMESVNEHYKHIPKKLKESFPQFAGIVLDYSYKGGVERQLHFCFKSKLEAQAFHAAVLIIKEATDRGSQDESSKTETMPQRL